MCEVKGRLAVASQFKLEFHLESISSEMPWGCCRRASGAEGKMKTSFSLEFTEYPCFFSPPTSKNERFLRFCYRIAAKIQQLWGFLSKCGAFQWRLPELTWHLSQQESQWYALQFRYQSENKCQFPKPGCRELRGRFANKAWIQGVAQGHEVSLCATCRWDDITPQKVRNLPLPWKEYSC